MKSIALFAFTILVIITIFFVYKFIKNVVAMIPSENIKVPSINDVNTIDDIVKPYIEHEKTKGISIGVYNDGAVNFYNYGTCSEQNLTSPTETSIYEIGSITKTFTTTVLAQLVQDRKVRYDDPISKYLPKSVVNWDASLRITLEELATHRSGLPRIPKNIFRYLFLNAGNPYKNYSERHLLQFLKSYTPTPIEKREANYSNLGMGLLGYILANIEGIPYERLIVNTILLPLKMNTTSIHKGRTLQVQGHNGYGQPISPWDIPALAGAGAFRSSTKDIMSYLIANIKSKSPFAATHTPRANFDEKSKIGLAWIITQSKDSNLEIYFHNGGTGGFRSMIAFSKKEQIGVVILSNSIQSVDEVGMRILELLMK